MESRGHLKRVAHIVGPAATMWRETKAPLD